MLKPELPRAQFYKSILHCLNTNLEICPCWLMSQTNMRRSVYFLMSSPKLTQAQFLEIYLNGCFAVNEKSKLIKHLFMYIILQFWNVTNTDFLGKISIFWRAKILCCSFFVCEILVLCVAINSTFFPFSLFHFFVQFMWFPWILVVFLGEICIISRVPYSCFCEKYMSNVWLLMYFSWNSCTSVFFVNFLLLFFVATHVFLWNSSGLCAYLFFSRFLCDYWC